MKTISTCERFTVKETGRNYDFGAVVINNTDKDITLVMDIDTAIENAIENFIRVPANDWTGIFYFNYEGNTKQALEQNEYTAYTDKELTEAGIEDPNRE